MTNIVIEPKKQEKFYHKRGNVYEHQGGLFMLAHIISNSPDHDEMVLISLNSGNRFSDVVRCDSFNLITESEFNELTGKKSSQFKYVKSLNIIPEY